MLSIPLWPLALVLAAAAPWAVHALEATLQRRVRRRTLALLAQALPGRRGPEEPRTGQTGDGSDGGARKP
jgi:hypothetical protein